jgi:hypothetical protein
MANAGSKLGGTSFKNAVPCRNEDVRVMEALGVITPSKADSGFRQFDRSDVPKARKWCREHKRERASA